MYLKSASAYTIPGTIFVCVAMEIREEGTTNITITKIFYSQKRILELLVCIKCI